MVWNLGPKGFQFSSISGYLLKNSSGLDQSFKTHWKKKQKVSKNSQKKLLKKMAKNSLKKITEKKSLKKFKRIWSVFKLSKNLTIMYFVIVVAFWGHPLHWEVNKRQGLQWQSENKRHFCETGKVSTVFPCFFFAFRT